MAFKSENHDDLTLFKNRLWKLMEDNGIKTSLEMAKNLICHKCLNISNFDELDSSEKSKKYDSERKKIDVHLKSDTAEHLQSSYLIAYCKFFNCSADYLLGFIDLPTHEFVDISKNTGLSPNAISTLKILANYSTPNFRNNRLEALNYMMKDTNLFFNFMSNISLYMNNDYTTPLFYDHNTGKYIDCSYHTPNGNGILFGKEVIDNKGNPGYACMGVETSILESHAMLEIQNIINEWRRLYKENPPAE